MRHPNRRSCRCLMSVKWVRTNGRKRRRDTDSAACKSSAPDVTNTTTSAPFCLFFIREKWNSNIQTLTIKAWLIQQSQHVKKITILSANHSALKQNIHQNKEKKTWVTNKIIFLFLNPVSLWWNYDSFCCRLIYRWFFRLVTIIMFIFKHLFWASVLQRVWHWGGGAPDEFASTR